MVRKEILDAFKDLDFKTYIDKTLTSTEHSLLKTELSKHEKIEREIKDEMFQTYTANIDHLVDILQKTHIISKLYEETKEDLNEYKRVFRYFDNEEDEDYIDSEKQKQFKELMSHFDKQSEIFVTDKRYLVHSDLFYADENNMKKSYLLLFCNDILIIGKNVMNRYVLQNAFNYSVIKLAGEDDKLIISVDPFRFVYSKDRQSVKNALEAFQEITYKKTIGKDKPEKNNIEDRNRENIEYFIFTEQYDKLVNYKASINTDIDFANVKIDTESLPLFLELFSTEKTRKKFFYDYLGKMIESKLYGVDIVQKLDSLIINVFVVFHDFCLEAKKMQYNYGRKYSSKKSDEALFILFLSYQIQHIFNMFKRRIFGRHSTIDNVNEYLDLIKDKLYFLGYDFRYMIHFFDNDKKEKESQSYESTKESINKLIDEMIAEDYA